jgi:AraC-like DNA-binding protein
MHRHMTKEIMEVEAELTQLRFDRGDPTTLLTVEQAAEISGMHVNTIRKLCRDGVWGSALLWRDRWLLDRADIERHRRGVPRNDGWVPITPEELEFLRSHQDMPASEISKHLNRPTDWVRDRRAQFRRKEGEAIWPRLDFRRRAPDDPQLKKHICELAESGYTLEQIAKRSGASYGAVRRILKTTAQETTGQSTWRKTKYAGSVTRKVRQLRSEGSSWREISIATGLPMSTVRHLVGQPDDAGQ